MALKTKSLMFLVTESFESNFGILGLFIIFERKLFNFSTVSNSDVRVVLISVRFIFSLDTDLSESKGFTLFKTSYL